MSNLVKHENIAIQAHSGKRLYEITELHKVSAMVHNWGVLMGVKAPPIEIELNEITTFLKEQFGNLTIDDITLALKLAAARKLDCDPETYQSISIVYFGRVLNAYKKYLHEKLKQQPKPKEVDNRTVEQKQKESYDNLIKFVKERNELPIGWNWLPAYFHADREKIIDWGNEERENFANKVRGQIKHEILAAKSKNDRHLLKKLEFRLESNYDFKTQCRIAAIKKHAETFIKPNN